MIVEIARGGMGEVFLAVSRGPGGFHKLVVIKELRASLATDSEFLTMFMAEARLSARLHHPNIVQTNEVGQEGNRYFMAMEYLEGQTLHRCLQRIPKDELSVGMQMRILVDALNGLHYAHELADYDGTPLHIVHRDISPHNILITYDGQPKILDFGIAKTRDSAQQTATGVLKGKVPYMAPEQLDRDQDRRADVFAVGVMLWEAVVGRRLWSTKTDPGIVQALAEGKIPSLRDAKPDVPDSLERIVSRALAPNREERYQTAQELAVDIEDYITANGIDVLPKQVGRLVSNAFTVERDEIRAVIDGQLRMLHEGQEEGEPSDQRVSIPRLTVAQAGEQTPSGESRGRSGKTPGGALVDVHATPITHTHGPAPKRSPKVVGLAALGVLALGSIIAAVVVRRPREEVAAASSSAPAVTASAATPEESQVEVVISATPSQARLFLDDAPLDSNPFRARVPKGGTHRIRAEAPGFVPASEMRGFDADLVVTFGLERAVPDAGKKAPAPVFARPAGRAPAAAPQPPHPVPAPGPAPNPSPPTHTIDPSDPYAK